MPPMQISRLMRTVVDEIDQAFGVAHLFRISQDIGQPTGVGPVQTYRALTNGW